MKKVTVSNVDIHNNELEFKAKAIAGWVQKQLLSEFLFKPRRGISENEQKAVVSQFACGKIYFLAVTKL